MKRKKEKPNIFKILSLILISIFLLVIPLFIQKLVKITKIECRTQFGDCDEVVVNRMPNVVGRDYKTVKEELEKLLQQNIQINSYLIQFKLPSTFKVELDVKKPTSAIKSSLNNKYYLLSSDGVILEEQDASDLVTLVVVDQNLQIGKKADEKYLFSLRMLNYLNYLFSISEGTVEKDHMRVKNSDGLSILMPTEGDIEYIIGSIRLIFSRLNKGEEGIRMNEISEIDLRFKNPVLRKK